MPLCWRRIRHHHLYLKSESSAQQICKLRCVTKASHRVNEHTPLEQCGAGDLFSPFDLPRHWTGKKKEKGPRWTPMSLCCRGKSPGLCCTVVGTEMGVPGNDSLQGRSFDFLGVSDHEFPPWCCGCWVNCTNHCQGQGPYSTPRISSPISWPISGPSRVWQRCCKIF